MKSSKELLVEQTIIENYEKYYRLAFSYVHHEQDALDIVQEGAYKAILKCDTLREENYVGSWVYRIMLNEIFQFCRKVKRMREELAEDPLLGHEGLAAEEGDNVALWKALDNLPEGDKAVLELRYFEDMKLEEIAEALGENLNTVKSRLYRALHKLRISLVK